MSNPKKPLVLGSEMFNFIANIASKSISKPEESSKSLGHEESDSMQIDEIKQEVQDGSLPDHFNSELNLNEDNDIKMKYESETETDKIISTLTETVMNKDTQEFNFTLLSKAEKEYLDGPLKNQNFLKGCKWSPDGTCIITNSDDSILRIYDTNNEMLNLNGSADTVEIHPSLKLVEPEIIYDYAWYPYMNSSDPGTACVFSTCKDNPIHLFDAYTSQIRCSYMGYNHLDELVSAYCIAFDSSCTKIYAGYNKCIKIFDIDRPGKNYRDLKTKDENHKLPGIVSCIAFSNSKSECFAVGSYSKYIGLYVESTNEPVCLIQAHNGGLTHLMFSQDGNKLFSGARKDSEIFCWDLRNPGKILQAFKRDIQTNQRIYFDLFFDCKYLCSGNNDGTISFWNGNDFNFTSDFEPVINNFKAHNDCVNGVSFNPKYSLLATSSGQRKYFNSPNNSPNTSDSEEDNTQKAEPIFENSLKIWKHSL